MTRPCRCAPGCAFHWNRGWVPQIEWTRMNQSEMKATTQSDVLTKKALHEPHVKRKEKR